MGYTRPLMGTVTPHPAILNVKAAWDGIGLVNGRGYHELTQCTSHGLSLFVHALRII